MRQHDPQLSGAARNESWTTNGTLLFQRAGPLHPQVGSSIGTDALLYVADTEWRLYSLYGNNGSMRFKVRNGHTRVAVPIQTTSTCTSQDGLVCATANSLYAFNAANGSVVWQVLFPCLTRHSHPLLDGYGALYAGLQVIVYPPFNTVNAFNATTGALLWSTHLP
jgi:outer membrane protein assembly factor BamB